MFGGDNNDVWKWMPIVLIVVALLFLFFDPFGMESTKIRYFVDNVTVNISPPLAPQPNPGGGGNPAPNPNPNPNPNPGGGGAGDFPSALNTGPQTPPTKTWPQAGNGTWIDVGADADGFIFNGCVRTTKSGVKITNSEIRGDCTTSILNDEGGGGTFEYNNIIDVGGHGASAIGCGFNSRFYKNNAKGGADGAKEGTGCQIIENYIHDLSEYLMTLPSGTVDGTHNDGVQIESGGTSGMLIQKNTFENTCDGLGPTGGCAGTVFINNGAAGNTVDGNYVKRWDGPRAGFVFHTQPGGVNIIKNNVVECGNITGFGVTSGGPSTFTNNTAC